MNYKQFKEFLRKPYIDKIIAFLAVIPFILALIDFAYMYSYKKIDILVLLRTLDLFFIVVPMLFRSPASRISLKPSHILITWGRTYTWFYLNHFIYDNSTQLIQKNVFEILIIIGLILTIYARISLGKSIGFLPAQRQIVTRGAYKYVRHPIQSTGIYILIITLLYYFSIQNLLFIATIIVIITTKSIIEENFLLEDYEYREYFSKVKFRWIPFIL